MHNEEGSMARVVKLGAVGVFSVGVLWLGAAAAVAGDDPAAPPAKQSQDKKAVARWLDRAEQFAAGLPEPQLIDVLPTLGDVMIAAGKDEQVDRLLATIKDPKRRADQDLMICTVLGSNGRYDAAIRRAQLLPTEQRTGPSGERANSWRAGALYMVALFQSSSHDFAEARKTIGLIDDPHTVSAAYDRLAENQAKAGLYAEAEQSLGKFVAVNEDDRREEERTRQLIARCKAEGRKDPPRKRSGPFLEALRRINTIFGDSGIRLSSLAEAERAEAAADKMTGAVDKANAWREIAWAYYDMREADKRNLDRARRAIEKSLKNAEQIAGGLGRSYMRTVAFASAANLYLDLGDPDAAKQWAGKADAVHLDDDMLGGLSAFTTTPMLIAVLVRVGDIDGATAIAEKVQTAADKKEQGMFPTNSDIAWATWATVCTLEGKTTHVERQSEKTDNPRTKAVLCAGVARGLLDLQRQPGDKKP
jgi:tetratricopeptide (TPR) repeat protein